MIFFFFLGVKSSYSKCMLEKKQHKRFLQMRLLFFFTPTYSVSVLAGNLGRVSMSTQEMVRVLHSEHSHSAGQESTCEPALTRRMTSVNSARVITCMPDGCKEKKIPQTISQNRRLSLQPGAPLGVHNKTKCVNRFEKNKNKNSLVCRFLFKSKGGCGPQVAPGVLLLSVLCTGAAQERKDAVGRAAVLDLEVVFNLRGGWTLMELLSYTE